MLKPGVKSQVSISAKIEYNVSLVTDFGMLMTIEKRKKKCAGCFNQCARNNQNKAKAISAELLELNLKNKLEETGKTR